jgi:hypothetical protein
MITFAQIFEKLLKTPFRIEGFGSFLHIGKTQLKNTLNN